MGRRLFMKRILQLSTIYVVFLLVSCTAVVNMNFLVEKQLPDPVLTIAGYDPVTERLTVAAALPSVKADVESDFSYNWLVDNVPVSADGSVFAFVTSEEKLVYEVACYLSKQGREDSNPVAVDVNLISLIGGLRLWLDAADPNTLTYDGDKRISSWADKSVFGNDADQYETGNSPMYIDRIQNDNSVVRFDGVDDYFPNVFAIPTSNMTVFTVFAHEHSATETAKGPLWQTDAYASVSGFYPYYETRQRLALSNSEWLESSSRFRADTWYVAEAVYDTNSVTLIRNGEEDGSDTSNAITNGPFLIAKSTVGDYFKGDIGEILFFNGTLPSSLTGKIRGYLMEKWGISPTQATPEPEITVLEDTTEYYTTQSIDVASVSSTTLETEFTIENTGTADLTVSQISVTGSYFLLDQPYANLTIPAGGSIIFTVNYTPLEAGFHNGVVTIECNDFDESAFVLNINGTATPYPEPEISLRRGDDDIESGGSYDFGSMVQNSGSKTVTLIILNTGTGDLAVNGVSVDDTGNYTVDTSSMLTTVPVGVSTSFDVTFAPLSTGTFDATLTIDNDDEDEGNYIVVLRGDGTAAPEPEITIRSIGGFAYPSDDVGYEFADQLSGTASTPPFTFVIHNDGTSPLLISSVTVDDETNFDLISSIDGETISSGDDERFYVAFTPQASGVYTAAVTVTNNDADENPYIINLTGEGVEPEISVWKGLTEYVNGGAPYDFGDLMTTDPGVEITYDVRNVGGAVLTVDGVAISDPVNYAVNWPYPADQNIDIGSGLPFTVTFDPVSIGTKNATLSIYNDSATSPFVFNITGNGTEGAGPSPPEITVTQSGDDYTSNVTVYDFGNVLINPPAPPEAVFEIENTGDEDLSITGIVLSDNTNYSFADGTTTATIAPGGSIYKTVTFDPQSTGIKDTTLSFFTNDADENPFELLLTGIGVVPEITITESVTEYFDDGAPFDFSYQKLSATSDVKTFTIENTGTYVLTVNTIVLSTGVSDYDLTEPSVPFDLDPAASETFTLTFTPTSEEVLTGTVTIGNTDPDRSSFVLNLTGEGDTGELTVLEGTTEYFDDDSTFYFDVTAAGDGPNNKTITLRNDGNVDLVISSFTDPVSPFSATTGPVTLTAGQETDILLSFDPDSSGGFSDTLIIDSDDIDEGTFTLNLRGGTTAPYIAGTPFIWLNAEDIRVGTDTVNEEDPINSGFKDYVFRWPDMSTGTIFDASALNAVASTSGEVDTGGNAHRRRLPEYHASVAELNGQPALRFRDDDGLPESTSTTGDDAPYYNGDVLYILGDAAYYDNFTIIIVMRPVDFIDSTGRTYMYGSNTPYLRLYDLTTSFYNNYNGTVIYHSDEELLLNETYCITNRARKWPATPAFDSSDSYRFWANGTEEIDNETDPPTSYTNQIVSTTRRIYAATLGNHTSNFRTYGISGYIPEVIIYKEALDESAVDLLHDYLNTKYGIWP